jgi:hypothetical protein
VLTPPGSCCRATAGPVGLPLVGLVDGKSYEVPFYLADISNTELQAESVRGCGYLICVGSLSNTIVLESILQLHTLGADSAIVCVARTLHCFLLISELPGALPES